MQCGLVVFKVNPLPRLGSERFASVKEATSTTEAEAAPPVDFANRAAAAAPDLFEPKFNGRSCRLRRMRLGLLANSFLAATDEEKEIANVDERNTVQPKVRGGECLALEPAWSRR